MPADISFDAATAWGPVRVSRLVLASVAWLVLAAPELEAQNWPQWRGPSSSRRLGRVTPADDVERRKERRVAYPTGRSRHFVTDRVGRPRVRHLTGRQHESGRRWGPSPAREGRPRACRTGEPDWRPAPACGPGRSEVWLVVEAFRRSDGERLWEYRTKAIGPHARGPREAQPRHADARHRRRSASTPGSATGRSSRSTWTAASSGRAISAWTIRRFRRSGGTAARRRFTAIS